MRPTGPTSTHGGSRRAASFGSSTTTTSSRRVGQRERRSRSARKVPRGTGRFHGEHRLRLERRTGTRRIGKETRRPEADGGHPGRDVHSDRSDAGPQEQESARDVQNRRQGRNQGLSLYPGGPG